MYIEKTVPNIIFNIALMCEAQPIINHFKLKKMLNINNPNSCLQIFKSNNFLGLLIFIGLIIGKY